MARNPLVELSKHVRAIRKEAGLSQQALADYADIDPLKRYALLRRASLFNIVNRAWTMLGKEKHC